MRHSDKVLPNVETQPSVKIHFTICELPHVFGRTLVNSPPLRDLKLERYRETVNLSTSCEDDFVRVWKQNHQNIYLNQGGNCSIIGFESAFKPTDTADIFRSEWLDANAAKVAVGSEYIALIQMLLF